MNIIQPIESKRLILREVVESDLDALHRILSDPIVMKFYPRVADQAETERWFHGIRRRYEQDGHSFFGVELKSDGEMIGICGLLNQQVEGVLFHEVGYLFARAWWHQGYATEAAQRSRDEGFITFCYDHIISIIDPGNTPSIRVAERNGMVYERTAPFKEVENASIYGITRAKWERLTHGQ